MDELSQILNCEENNKKRLQKAKESAEREIENKKKENSEKLSSQAGSMDDGKKTEILKQKEEEIERIKKETSRDLDLKISYLKNKKESKEKSIIDYIVTDFLNS